MLLRAEFPCSKKLSINCHRQGQAWREQPEPESAPAFHLAPSLDAPGSVSSSRSGRPRAGACRSQQLMCITGVRPGTSRNKLLQQDHKESSRRRWGRAALCRSHPPTPAPACGGPHTQEGNVRCVSICRGRHKPRCSLCESFAAPSLQLCPNSAILVHWLGVPRFQGRQAKLWLRLHLH